MTPDLDELERVVACGEELQRTCPGFMDGKVLIPLAGLKSLIAAARAGVPDGYRLVPVVPTVDMLVSATEEWLCVRATEDRASFIWDAMLAAAPQPPVQQPPASPLGCPHNPTETT